MNKRKKYSVTLIEIMIVILLIGLISGALVFNMRGSMDKGRVFKSQQNAQRVYDALMMANASGEFDLQDFADQKKVLAVLNKSPFIKNGDAALVDGWGDQLHIELREDDIEVFSQRALDWENARKR